MTVLTAEQLAVAFVDLLVPGRFDEARRMLDLSCEYVFGGEVLRGEAIIAAFERSDEDAKKKLDRIEYLPGRVAATEARLSSFKSSTGSNARGGRTRIRIASRSRSTPSEVARSFVSSTVRSQRNGQGRLLSWREPRRR